MGRRQPGDVPGVLGIVAYLALLALAIRLGRDEYTTGEYLALFALCPIPMALFVAALLRFGR